MAETLRSACTFTLTEVLQAVRRDFVPCPHSKCKSSVQSFTKNGLQQHWRRFHEGNPSEERFHMGRSLLKTIHFNLVKEKLTGEFMKKKDQVSLSDRDFTVPSKVFRFIYLVLAAIDRYEFFKLIWAQN